MNREILFRGFHKNKHGADIAIIDGKQECGTWIYGDLVHRGGEVYVFTPDGLNRYEVDPSTVGQYTGLTDNNGVKIFEGDIVRLYLIDPIDATESGYKIGQIEWLATLARFAFVTPYGHVCGIDCVSDMEVIGNIHDNPELIGGEGND